MEEAFLRFSHLPEQIFKKIDNVSLSNSRMVMISWKTFIDERQYPWIRFNNFIDGAERRENAYAVKLFFIGHAEMVLWQLQR